MTNVYKKFQLVYYSLPHQSFEFLSMGWLEHNIDLSISKLHLLSQQQLLFVNVSQYINATSTGAMKIFSEHNRNQCFIINEVSEVENVDIGEPCFLS